MLRRTTVVPAIFAGVFVLMAVSCDQGTSPTTDETIAVSPQIEMSQSMLLDSTHRRVIQECSQAMAGSWDTYNETNWPYGPTATYATYSYTNADTGAWDLLKTAYSGKATNGTYYPGFYVSCMRYRSEGYLPAPYTKCHLSLSTGYGSFEMPNYTCQGNCANHKRGGQCYGFMNLVAYRSGTYQLSGYGFKTFPSDNCIKYTTATCGLPDPQKVLRPANDTNMPLATYANIVEGDFLRSPSVHAAIVVRKVSSTQVVVLDSNWSDGDGYEVVSSHTLGFSGDGSSKDLGTYRVLKCAYTGGC